ncbi:hypothetical protein AB4Z45_21830 [Paenibacillus sp. MCAF9]|uniref:hypothetical protein n=1 Tax=Paenibacillus sp. MCAF9 TaxID=3233046 RepID=UPI003F9A0F78
MIRLVLTNQEKLNVIKYIKDSFQDIELKTFLTNFAENLMSKAEFVNSSLSSVRNDRHRFKNVRLMGFLNSMKEFCNCIEDVNWFNYCNMFQKLSVLKLSEGWFFKSQELISEFYVYLSKNTTNVNVSRELEKCLHLLITNELYKKADRRGSEFFTNFPLNTPSEHIIQIYINDGREGKCGAPFYANVNINTADPFIYILLKKFLIQCGEKYTRFEFVNRYYVRLFFYFYVLSLKELNIEVNDYSSFNRETFFQQYYYFKDKESLERVEKQFSPTSILIRFYLFLDNIYTEEFGMRLFISSEFNSSLLSNNKFFTFTQIGYSFIYRTPHELVPKTDKWVIINKMDNRANAYMTNYSIDFEIVENDEFRQELKQYIWESSYPDSSVLSNAKHLIYFLNAAHMYINENRGQLVKDKRLFSYDFLLKYRSELQMSTSRNTGKKVKSSYINSHLAAIRKYLRHFKVKYGVTEIAIKNLASLPKDYNGGNPFNESDFKIIEKEIKEKSLLDVTSALLYIIFQLATTTKLRLGEILRLERDCIISISRAMGSGEISYYSKTSYNEKVTDIFLLEDILLIERAIMLTKELSGKAPDEIRKYIFLTHNQKSFTSEVKTIGSGFSDFFCRKIIRSLLGEGKLDKSYTAYNTRDTFINKVWEGVEDGLISTLEVGVITGNTASVASKHYRKQQTTRFIEATYMITVGDVNLDGEVIINENEIINLPQVGQSSGGCKSVECIKINSEDSDYKCLTCSKFITSISRKNIFEERIANYVKRRDESLNDVERKYYQGLVELHGTYLSKIYDIVEEVGS